MITWLNSDERGASAVLVAASLFLLMGFAALTVDWGAATNQRRQNQSGADFGVLAGAQFANVDALPAECTGMGYDAVELAACSAAVEVREVVNGNLGLSLTAIDWSACVDTGVAAWPEFTSSGPNSGFASPITDCVRFTETMQKIRVVIPTVQVETTFGKVMGRAFIDTGAFAHAQADLREQSRLIPFALPGSAAGASYNCLRAGAGNIDWGVCADLPAVGNFGSLDVPVYGNDTLGTLADADDCNPDASSLLSNIVRGVDHILEPHSNGVMTPANPAKQDDNGPDTADRFYVCPIFGAKPNEVDTRLGIGSELDDGMTFGFGASERGRIWGSLSVRAAGAGNPETFLDDQPLWSFLTTTGFCPPGPPPTDTARMIECLDNWTVADGVIFSTTLGTAPRYGFVPEFWSFAFTPGDPYLIDRFRPVYINTSYYGCNAGGPAGIAGRCNIIHTPGEADTGPCADIPEAALPGDEPPDTTCGLGESGTNGMNAITAYTLDPLMLPPSLRDAFPDAADSLEYALIR